jgi:cobalt/nickel transport system permease protein
MHIPDGYLAPAVSLALAVPTMPVWALASQRVKAVLNNRTVPLLAIFSALSFTIMMFNVPVPGGTTAHGVGGTLIAVVLGPWAAVIAVSTALILQALFFGDGGILAIFANCLNMGVILPFVGYAAYRLLAAGSPALSTRRAVAAGVGAYVGITAAALAVGVELGLQPVLFSSGGHATYSPYGLREAVPAMLAAHAFGASIVEGLITGLGVAYLQRSHPEYLTGLRASGIPTQEAAIEARPARRPLWRGALVAAVGGTALLVASGLVAGGGRLDRMFGADWSKVDWPSVASMLAATAAVGLVLVPAAWVLMPSGMKRVGAGFVALAIVTPLGLIAPGFAYGEGRAADVGAVFGYVPPGLQSLSGLFSAPMAGYNLPLPFFSAAHAPLWHAALGYELAGIVGMLAAGCLTYLVARLLRPAEAEVVEVAGTGVAVAPVLDGRHRSRGAAPGPAGPSRRSSGGRVSWLERTFGGITESIEHAVFSEWLARRGGWLQRRDPRAKLVGTLVAIVAASLTASFAGLAILYAATLAAARASGIPFGFFVKRVWLGIPFFAGIVVLPSIFFVPGDRAFDLALGPAHLAPSWNGLVGAGLFVSRVGVSVSLAVLLVVTTPWAGVLKSLRALHAPAVFVLVLSMTYRYIFLFLHTTNGILLARKSRVVGATSGHEQRRWITGTMGNLMSRAFKMSNDVYAAMLARGFTGEVRVYSTFRMRAADWAGLGGAFVACAAAILSSRVMS